MGYDEAGRRCGATRRAVLAAGLTLAATGCTIYDDRARGSGPSPAPLPIKASQIPEGGGVIFPDQDVVITQPERDSFRAFSATCTHARCLLIGVDGGTINCACHGSKFKIADGTVAAGPAQEPLAAKTCIRTGDDLTVV